MFFFSPRVAAANRGNDLLINTLKTRYPYIVNEDTTPYIRTWLSARTDLDRARILSSYTSENQHVCESILVEHVNSLNGLKKYPIELGKEVKDSDNNNGLSKDLKLSIAVYLADKYLSNFESSHCQPLANEFFRIPWSENLLVEKRYKF